MRQSKETLLENSLPRFVLLLFFFMIKLLFAGKIDRQLFIIFLITNCDGSIKERNALLILYLRNKGRSHNIFILMC